MLFCIIKCLEFFLQFALLSLFLFVCVFVLAFFVCVCECVLLCFFVRSIHVQMACWIRNRKSWLSFIVHYDCNVEPCWLREGTMACVTSIIISFPFKSSETSHSKQLFSPLKSQRSQNVNVTWVNVCFSVAFI